MLIGADLRKEPLVDRRRRLEELLRRDPDSLLQFSADIEGNGPAFFAAIDELGLEGIVSKRPESRYISGRVKSWLKCKTSVSHDYQVVGVDRTSTGIPIALLATAGDDPHYVGNAMITLPAKEAQAFWKRIDALGSPQARLRELHKRKAKWIGPGLLATVRHLRGEDKLRHATLLSVRDENG